MAPSKPKRAVATKAAPRMDMSDSDEPAQSQEPSQSQSQENDARILGELVKKRNEKSKARKAQRLKEIEAARMQRIDKIERKMNELKRNHEAELRKLQTPKVARLRELIQMRRDIDENIATCWRAVDSAYEATVQQYQFALKGRLEDLG